MQILSPILPKSGIFHISQEWQQQYGYGHSPFESTKSPAGTAKTSSEEKAKPLGPPCPRVKGCSTTRHHGPYPQPREMGSTMPGQALPAEPVMASIYEIVC